MSKRLEVFICRDLYFSSIWENLSFCCSTTLKPRKQHFNRACTTQKATFRINIQLFTHQLRAPHATSDNRHIKLLMSRLNLFAPGLFLVSVFTFWASSLQFADVVSVISSLCFCDWVFFLCFTSVGILAHWYSLLVCFTVKGFKRPNRKYI